MVVILHHEIVHESEIDTQTMRHDDGDDGDDETGCVNNDVMKCESEKNVE